MYINKKNISDSLFQPRGTQSSSLESPTHYISLGFTISGQEDELLNLAGERDDKGYPIISKDNEHCYAKIEVTEMGYPVYYIKQGPTGGYYNPLGMDQHSLSKRRNGEILWKFRKVNKISFDYYIQFLKTKKTAFLVQAEREI
jgi:hypothetical protein